MMSLEIFKDARRRRKKKKEQEKSKCKKITLASIRIQTDFDTLDIDDMIDDIEVKLINPENLLHFDVFIKPKGSLWKGGKYHFHFDISDEYPHKTPSVICKTKIFHPNINLQNGKICLNIFSEWKPIYSIQHIIHGLIFLFYEPNASDPVNIKAGEVYRNNYNKFKDMVTKSLKGDKIDNINFQKFI